MRKLLGTFMLGVIVLGLIGLFRGWFSVSTDTQAEQTKIEVTIDKERVKQDADRLKSSVRDLSERVQSGVNTNSAESTGAVLPPDSDSTARPVLPPDLEAGRQF